MLYCYANFTYTKVILGGIDTTSDNSPKDRVPLSLS
jgi:hypothetical protein